MQIEFDNLYEIADCFSEEEILQYREELKKAIDIFNKAISLKIIRLENLKIK
jgi:hypothetical protein